MSDTRDPLCKDHFDQLDVGDPNYPWYRRAKKGESCAWCQDDNERAADGRRSGPSEGDLEQMAQEDAIWPWLADESMADEPMDY